MTVPSLAKPNTIKIAPAIKVAICKPAMPCCAVMIDSTAMNAPVGPDICTRVPPKIAVKRPATMAVYRPCSGRAPDAMAKAMPSGKATTPTTIPASKLLRICPRDHRPAALASSSAITAAALYGTKAS